MAVDAKAFFDELWAEAQNEAIPVEIVDQPTIELIGVMSDPESVIERAGRVCWLSYDKVKEGSAGKFVEKLVTMQHGSVLCFTFWLESRIKSWQEQGRWGKSKRHIFTGGLRGPLLAHWPF